MSGGLPFVRTACAVGKGVDCLPMAKPVVRVISWGSAVGWGLGRRGPSCLVVLSEGHDPRSFGVGDWT
jgi:hypothetical protein